MSTFRLPASGDEAVCGSKFVRYHSRYHSHYSVVNILWLMFFCALPGSSSALRSGGCCRNGRMCMSNVCTWYVRSRSLPTPDDLQLLDRARLFFFFSGAPEVSAFRVCKIVYCLDA